MDDFRVFFFLLNSACIRFSGDVDVDGLLSALMQTVFMFSEQQLVECKEEEERAAREMIKVEQDQAYQQSLEMDRYVGCLL